MTKKKILYAVTLCVIGYISLLYLNSKFHFSWMRFTLVGVFHEMVMIPALLLQMVLLFLMIEQCVSDRCSLMKLSFWLALGLLWSNGFVVLSFAGVLR